MQDRDASLLLSEFNNFFKVHSNLCNVGVGVQSMERKHLLIVWGHDRKRPVSFDQHLLRSDDVEYIQPCVLRM